MLINSTFTCCIVWKCVLVVCGLASLLLDTLNLVKDLGYCIASRQISSGTNACKNTQTRLCSVVRASLLILLCPWNGVASSLSAAKESASSHWALAEGPCLTLACESCVFHPAPQNLPGTLSQTGTSENTISSLRKHFSWGKERWQSKKADFLNRFLTKWWGFKGKVVCSLRHLPATVQSKLSSLRDQRPKIRGGVGGWSDQGAVPPL